MTDGEPSNNEAIFVRLEAGEETAAISLDREVFEGGIAHEDGAITLSRDSASMRAGFRLPPPPIGLAPAALRDWAIDRFLWVRSVGVV